MPKLDRPLRFLVSRGSRGSIRAQTLAELQESLEGPWRPDFGSANSNVNRKGRRQMAQGKTKSKGKSRGGLPRPPRPPKRGGRR